MCKTWIGEDNVTFRQMLKESLCYRFPTMEIEEEPDGRNLFNKIAFFHPKIVFMDIRLPGGNGLELTKKIKKNYPDIIIVIMIWTNTDRLPGRAWLIILSRRVRPYRTFKGIPEKPGPADSEYRVFYRNWTRSLGEGAT
jgi:CheY-like chemotaxis protein